MGRGGRRGRSPSRTRRQPHGLLSSDRPLLLPPRQPAAAVAQPVPRKPPQAPLAVLPPPLAVAAAAVALAPVPAAVALAGVPAALADPLAIPAQPLPQVAVAAVAERLPAPGAVPALHPPQALRLLPQIYFKTDEAAGFIGRSGENINEFTKRAGIQIQVQRDAKPSEGLSTMHIEATNNAEFDRVVQMLIDTPKLSFLQNRDGRVIKDQPVGGQSLKQDWGRGGSRQDGQEMMEELWVPDRLVGLCIGNRGENILTIERTTQTKCTVHKFCPPGRYERCIEIHGRSQGIVEAKARLLQTIGEVQSKPPVRVKDDYDHQDPVLLEKIRKLVDYEEL